MFALLTACVGLALSLFVMSADRALPYGVPLGAAGLSLLTLGMLAAFGYFQDDDEPFTTTPLRALTWPACVLVAASSLAVFVVRAAVRGELPRLLPSTLIVPMSLLATLLAAIWSARRFGALELDERGERRTLFRRHGFWLVLGLGVVYLPGLGTSSLIDPWETHYGEVAREVLARNDWISFWWAQDGFFLSKPALAIWLEALSFSLFGLRFLPDQMLASAARGKLPEPEWAVRLPALVLAGIATYFAYLMVARAFGRKQALVSAIALATTPFWAISAHQATTDMPYVAGVTVAVSLLILGMRTDPQVRVRCHALAIGALRVRLSGAHVLFALVAFTALAQIVYLVSRHLEHGPHGVHLQADQFLGGSGAGLCALAIPGNEPCALLRPAYPLLAPALSAALFSAVLAAFLWKYRRERRLQRLQFLGAWYALCLAALAKGAPGLVLPLGIALVALVASGRPRSLFRLELPGLGLLLVCVALPWYVQAFARHGDAFFDRLFRHDMYGRAFLHVHDTNGTDDVSVGYYLWQLGYGLFPWSAFAAVATIGALGNEQKQRSASEALTWLGAWFLFSFAVFAAALTKYHHYILPAVVPAALLAGFPVARALSAWPGATSAEKPRVNPLASAVLGLSGLCGAGLIGLIGRDLVTRSGTEGQARLINLVTYNYARAWPESLDFRHWIWVTAGVAATVSALWLVPRLRRLASGAFVLVSVAFCVFVLHVYLPKTAPHWGQRALVLEYYRHRKGPSEPLIAYQMNWKGENFYSGNQVSVFVTTGERFQSYLRDLERRGTRSVFVMTEHSRQKLLEEELGAGVRLHPLTNREQNNKFFLARVEL